MDNKSNSGSDEGSKKAHSSSASGLSTLSTGKSKSGSSSIDSIVPRRAIKGLPDFRIHRLARKRSKQRRIQEQKDAAKKNSPQNESVSLVSQLQEEATLQKRKSLPDLSKRQRLPEEERTMVLFTPKASFKDIGELFKTWRKPSISLETDHAKGKNVSSPIREYNSESTDHISQGSEAFDSQLFLSKSLASRPTFKLDEGKLPLKSHSKFQSKTKKPETSRSESSPSSQTTSSQAKFSQATSPQATPHQTAFHQAKRMMISDFQRDPWQLSNHSSPNPTNIDNTSTLSNANTKPKRPKLFGSTSLHSIFGRRSSVEPHAPEISDKSLKKHQKHPSEDTYFCAVFDQDREHEKSVASLYPQPLNPIAGLEDSIDSFSHSGIPMTEQLTKELSPPIQDQNPPGFSSVWSIPKVKLSSTNPYFHKKNLSSSGFTPRGSPTSSPVTSPLSFDPKNFTTPKISKPMDRRKSTTTRSPSSSPSIPSIHPHLPLVESPHSSPLARPSLASLPTRHRRALGSPSPDGSESSDPFAVVSALEHASSPTMPAARPRSMSHLFMAMGRELGQGQGLGQAGDVASAARKYKVGPQERVAEDGDGGGVGWSERVGDSGELFGRVGFASGGTREQGQEQGREQGMERKKSRQSSRLHLGRSFTDDDERWNSSLGPRDAELPEHLASSPMCPSNVNNITTRGEGFCPMHSK